MILSLFAFLGCEPAEPPPPPPVEDKCPEVSFDGMAIDWIHVKGNTGDHTHRMRIFKEEGEWRAWYVGGFFKKVELIGQQRSNDVLFKESLSPEKETIYKAGGSKKLQLYVRPKKSTCSLHVTPFNLEIKQGKEVEIPIERSAQEYLPFPENQVFTYRPCDEALSIGPAASNRALREKEIKQLGTPNYQLEGDAIWPAGFWSDASADGDPSCSYTMDLYFDDRPVAGKQGLPAGEVKKNLRHWYAEWEAPYSGNHHFEMYRYRTCDEKKELIAVSCIEAVL